MPRTKATSPGAALNRKRKSSGKRGAPPSKKTKKKTVEERKAEPKKTKVKAKTKVNAKPKPNGKKSSGSAPDGKSTSAVLPDMLYSLTFQVGVASNCGEDERATYGLGIFKTRKHAIKYAKTAMDDLCNRMMKPNMFDNKKWNGWDRSNEDVVYSEDNSDRACLEPNSPYDNILFVATEVSEAENFMKAVMLLSKHPVLLNNENYSPLEVGSVDVAEDSD